MAFSENSTSALGLIADVHRPWSPHKGLGTRTHSFESGVATDSKI